jgi:hypothetical protein
MLLQDAVDEARWRLRSKEWEDDKKRRRAREFEATLKQLEMAEYKASFPDNPNRIADSERIRADKKEVLSMMDEEFKLSEQYKGTVGE